MINAWNAEEVHPDLREIKNRLYNTCEFNCSQPTEEDESSEYGAYHFKLNSQHIRFRVAKTTPTKPGQFVTLWKRIEKGPIQPFDATDTIDLCVISTREENYFGQFVFPKSVLIKNDIFSVNGQGGKRAIRVYPPWFNKLNKQAEKTQQWQIQYFLDLTNKETINIELAEKLYQVK